MIKFFRHIRKSLLEQNKMGKYFKYAFGEIILVVIGILIALQINNWNENRKDQKLLENYYQQLLAELELDVSAIQFSVTRLENDTKQFKKITKKLAKPNLDLDTILKIYDKADFIIDNSSFNTKTIDVLLSTGDIKLINSKIKNALLALQDEQEDHLIDNNQRFKFYSEIVGSLTYTFPINKELFLKQEKLSNTISLRNKMIAEIPNLNKALQTRNSSIKADLNELNNVLNLTKELQRFIKAELNK